MGKGYNEYYLILIYKILLTIYFKNKLIFVCIYGIWKISLYNSILNFTFFFINSLFLWRYHYKLCK